MPILFIIGVLTVERARMETEIWRPVDRVAVFIGRVTMVLISALTTVMIYEAELFGPNLLVSDLAKKAGTIPWEILTQITPRVSRIYR